MNSLRKLHPFLVAVYPVLKLASHNGAQVSFEQLFLPCLLAAALAAVLLVGLWLACRYYDHAAILTSILLVAFFSYGHLFEWIWSWNVFSSFTVVHTIVSAGMALVLLPAAFAVLRSKTDLGSVGIFLGAMSALFVTISAVVWGVQQHGTLSASTAIQGFANPTVASSEGSLDSIAAEASSIDRANKPDVYFIVLDAYARADTLKDIFGHDNKSFLDFLESRDFYIAHQSNSNYPLTQMSLAATLNMRHVDDIAAALVETHGEDTQVNEPLFELIQAPRVAEIFKSKGYRYVTFLTYYAGTDRSRTADVTYSYAPIFGGEFFSVLLRTTALRAFAPSVAQSHLYAFEKIREVPKLQGPTFTFLHLLLPHNPYVFDRHGNVRHNVPLTLQLSEKTGGWADKKAYIEQLVFLNDQIKAIVDHLLATSETDPIIIIQGDHGSAATRHENGREMPRARERLSILNAMRVPEAARRRLYPTITPINTFPILLNAVFQEDIAILPDRSYHAWVRRPYDLEDMTEEIAAPRLVNGAQ